MKCPYRKADCKHVNTSAMTKDVMCINCDWYDDGIKETGAMPVLDNIITFFRNFKKYF